MTKTTFIRLCGGTCVTALFVLGLVFAASNRERTKPVAWEQPPSILPKPQGGIRPKAAEPMVLPVLAWEQPPSILPKPSGTIRRKATEEAARVLV